MKIWYGIASLERYRLPVDPGLAEKLAENAGVLAGDVLKNQDIHDSDLTL
ncbi:MAG: hypothetical protein GY889_05455 [Proteobacteria bacterium]|nr:hypothetical protein [Pseudomonadota bacterium]